VTPQHQRGRHRKTAKKNQKTGALGERRRLTAEVWSDAHQMAWASGAARRAICRILEAIQGARGGCDPGADIEGVM